MAQVSKHLGDLLVQENILSQQELEEVLEKSKSRNLSLEETLFRLGYISKDRLGLFYAQLYGGEFLTAGPRPIPDAALTLVPAATAQKLQVIPYQLEDDVLSVLMAGPFEDPAFEDVVGELEEISQKKVRAVFCSLSMLKELLLKYYPESDPKNLTGRNYFSPGGESSTFQKSESLRTEFEELYDVGQTALIGARSHPFNRAVSASIDEAKRKLGDAGKFMDSGFEEEALQMASEAVHLLQEATTRADTIEKDWEKLVQQVKALRARITTLEEESAAGYAPSEFKELTEIREALIECINDRNVDKLRYLLDQGTIIIERVGLLSPNRNKGREEMMSSLVQVRQVIARARKAGAREFAPDILKEAYIILEKAEAGARRARWDEVRASLSSAEAKAVEAEEIALRAAEEAKRTTVKLRETIRLASSTLEQAMACPFAQEAIEELIKAKDAIGEAKACFEDARQSHGISLAEETIKRLREEIIPWIRESERKWNELFERADKASAKIRMINIPLMLKVDAAKVEPLLHAEREMAVSLYSRDREKLAPSIAVCEHLLEQVEDSYAEATGQINNAQEVAGKAIALLSSAAAAGIDADVAPAFVQAGLLVEHAWKKISDGNAKDAADRADAAVALLREQVAEPQRTARELWSDMVLETAALLEDAGEVLDVNASHRCPKEVSLFCSCLPEFIVSLASRDAVTFRAKTASLKESLHKIRNEVAVAQQQVHREVSTELSEIEQRVKAAVEKCSGYYAPDALESVYLDIKRLWGKLSEGAAAMDVASESIVRRDLAVAHAKLWQVEFLRERFEREREETVRQLRLKMESAREEIETCAAMDFISDDSPLLQEARSLLEQADNMLIEGNLEEGFELVRQSRSTVAELATQAQADKKRWNELMAAVKSECTPHTALLHDSTAQQIAPDEFLALSELDSRTSSIIESKIPDRLAEHAERLKSLAADLADRVKKAKEENRERARQKLREAHEQIKLAHLLHADALCPDTFSAACSFEQISSNYLQDNDYDQAIEAATDALAKATDAVTFGKAGIERSGALAADFMKIAANHIAQGRAQDATEALNKGLSLIKHARITSE